MKTQHYTKKGTYIMKKNIARVLVLALGMTMLGGCGKKDKVDADDMIEKYANYCELGDYKGVEYEKTVYEITEEMYQAQIDTFLSSLAENEDITDDVTKEGDIVNIDFVGTIDGEEFNGGSTDQLGCDVTLGSNTMLFEDDLYDHKVGDKFVVSMTFPEDYMTEAQIELAGQDLNGKEAEFDVTINSIKRPNIPELTDALVQANTDYETVAEYKENIKKNLDEAYATMSTEYDKSAVITVVADNATVTQYPEQELQKLIDEAIENVTNDAGNYGLDLGSYVISMYGMSSEEEFKQYVSDLAKSYLDEKIIICAIAKAEGITATNEEVEAAKPNMMKDYGYGEDNEEAFDEAYDAEDIVYYTVSQKVYTFLLENNVGVEPTEEAE